MIRWNAITRAAGFISSNPNRRACDASIANATSTVSPSATAKRGITILSTASRQFPTEKRAKDFVLFADAREAEKAGYAPRGTSNRKAASR